MSNKVLSVSRCWTNLNSFLLTLLTSRGKHPLFRVYNFFLTRPKVKFWVNFHVPKLAILLEVSKATSGGLFRKQNEWLNFRINLKLLASRSFLWYFQYFYRFSYVPLMMISILASSDFLPPTSPFVAKSRFDERFFYLWNCNRSEDALYFHTSFWWWFQYLYGLSYVFLLMTSIFCNVRCSSYYKNISKFQKVNFLSRP